MPEFQRELTLMHAVHVYYIQLYSFLTHFPQVIFLSFGLPLLFVAFLSFVKAY